MLLQQAWATPWKVQNQIGRWLTYPSARLVFALNGLKWGRHWKCYGVPIIQRHRYSRMAFGDGLQLRSSIHSNPLAPTHPVVLATWYAEAVLEVGENFSMTGGVICAAHSIVVGHNVAIGANTTIMDTDFHPLAPELRRLHPSMGHSASIVIADDVFIGAYCLILKGTTIGTGSVIGAGSVVTRDIPPGTIAAGNPARVVETLTVQS